MSRRSQSFRPGQQRGEGRRLKKMVTEAFSNARHVKKAFVIKHKHWFPVSITCDWWVIFTFILMRLHPALRFHEPFSCLWNKQILFSPIPLLCWPWGNWTREWCGLHINLRASDCVGRRNQALLKLRNYLPVRLGSVLFTNLYLHLKSYSS